MGLTSAAPDWIATFADAMRLERGLCELTVNAYAGDVRQFAELAGKPLDEVTRDDVRAFMSRLFERGASGRTVARKLTSLRIFYDFLLLEGYVARNPARGVPLPKQWHVLPKALDARTLERVLLPPEPDSSALQMRDAAICMMFYASGVRVSELCNVRLTDLDLVGQRALVVDGKGAKDRLVPLGRATEPIRHYLERSRPLLCGKSASSDYVFIGRRGQRVTRQRVVQIVKARGGGSPHRLRHTMATHLVEGGCSLPTVQMLLGHEDIATTAVYLHTDMSHLRRQLLKFHPRASRTVLQ